MSGLSTKHMVLGLLIERPGYGYGLAQLIADRFGFLNLAQSAVYKTLQRLEEEGLVEPAGYKRVKPSPRAAPRVLYRATPEGVAEFRRWMAAPVDRPILRDELQAKMALATPNDLPDLIRAAEGQLEACMADLEQLTRPSLTAAGDPAIPWPHVALMMADDFKARLLEATVDWLNATIAVMEKRLERGTARPKASDS